MLGVTRVLVLILPVIFAATADERVNTTCSNHLSNSNVPVVSICTDSHASAGYIIIDGYYANTATDRTCSCVVKSNKKQTLKLEETPHFTADINRTLCGSMIKVQSKSASFFLQCSHSGKINVQSNEEINITLYKNIPSADTRYCFRLGQEDNSFNVSCFGNYVSSTTTVEETTDTIEISSELYTTEGPTSTTTEQIRTSSENALNTTARLNHVNLDSTSTYMYVGIGAGCGAVLFIALVVAACLHYRRRAQLLRDQSKTIGNEPENCDEDDELHYNVLYTSSTESATNSNSIEGTKISYCTADTYHTIGMEETAATSENNGFDQSTANAKPSIKPDIAPKPITASVKHVLAPGENGCEYAVVQKTESSSKVTSENNVEDNTYSVVDKKKHTSILRT